MGKQNQHIEQYLDAYLKMADTDFAIMIAGPWGCGKTHFIKQYLDAHCSTVEGNKEYIFISLNGLSKTTDIDMAMFQAAHPILGSKLAVTAGRIFKASVKAGLKIDLDINRNGNTDGTANFDLPIDSFKLKAKSKLLIFDDLERCLLKPEEVLGYINAFVESKESKVIIIGEEDYLNKNSDEKYRCIKEKVVGKTFRLTEQIEEIFGDLISSSASYPETHEIISRNKATVIRLFQLVDKETRRHNYRALKHCFRDFEYFFRHIDEQFRNNFQFINDLFSVFLLLGYELQLDNFTPEELGKMPNTDFQQAQGIPKDGMTREMTRLEKVFSRHGLNSPPIFDGRLWCKIFQNEQLRSDEISVFIKNSSYFPEEQPEWVVLWHWRRIEDAEAAIALDGVRNKLKTFEYVSCEEIMHVFSILLGLSELGAISETKRDLLEEAQSYLNKLIRLNKMDLPSHNRRQHWLHLGSFGLGYWGEDKEEEYTALISLIDEAIKRSDEAIKKTSVSTWLTMLKDSPEVFLSRLDPNGEFCRDPVLKYFQPAEFVSALLKIPNQKMWMVSRALTKRYEMCKGCLAEELSFFEGIVRELTNLLDSRKGLIVPSTANLKYLKDELEKVASLIRQSSEIKHK